MTNSNYQSTHSSCSWPTISPVLNFRDLVAYACTSLPSESVQSYNHLCVTLQDIEFTVQEGRLWMLQCRTGKRTGAGAVKIAVDMVFEGLIDKHVAIHRVEPQHLDQLLHPQVRYDINMKKPAEYAGNYVLL